MAKTTKRNGKAAPPAAAAVAKERAQRVELRRLHQVVHENIRLAARILKLRDRLDEDLLGLATQIATDHGFDMEKHQAALGAKVE